MHLINDKKITRSWAMYDWANSVYLLVILTAIFPAFYTDITSVDGSDKVQFMGREFVNSALYLYVLSFSYMLIALISPLLASIADYRGNKKRFMQVFVWIGAGSCAALYFFDVNNLY
ncbi:MAG: MFS transporter, partial [Bacteroidetes bacterium]|nr:MFS transporter [Bacteroidota bacterium]